MAREEVELLWCDRCLLLHKQQKPARALVVTYDGEEVLRSELCELHRAEAVRAIRKVLPRRTDARGRAAGRHRRRTDRNVGPFACQICRTQAKHRASLSQHVQRIHEVAWEDYLEKYGEPRVMTQAEIYQEYRVSCELCGQTYSTAEGTRFPYSALVSHMRGRHGLKLLPGGELVEIG